MTTLGYTHKEFLQRISYPRPKKKEVREVSLKTDIGREALEIYYTAKAKKNYLEKLRMTTSLLRGNEKELIACEQANAVAAAQETAANGDVSSRETERQLADLMACLEKAEEVVEATGASLSSSFSHGDEDPRAAILESIADLLRLQGRFSDASFYYSRVIALLPLRTICYLRKAECLAQAGDPVSALGEYKKFMLIEVPTKAVLVAAATTALDARQLETARELFENSLALEEPYSCGEDGEHGSSSVKMGVPDSEKNRVTDNYALYYLGTILEQQGFYDRAVEVYKSVSKNFITPFYTQGRTMLSQGAYQEALGFFEAVARVCKDDPGLLLYLADAHAAFLPSHVNNVLECFTKALDIPDGNAPCSDNFEKYGTVVLDEYGTPARYTDGSPHHELCYLRRGLVYLDVIGDVEAALCDLTSALNINESNVEALTARARAYLLRVGSDREDDERAAMDDYQKIVSLSYVPISVKAQPYARLGMYFYSKDNFGRAAKYFSYAILAGETASLNSFSCLDVYSAIFSHVASKEPESEYRPYNASGGNSAQKTSLELAISSPPSSSSPTKGTELAVQGAIPLAPLLPPVQPALYWLGEAWYVETRHAEPTVHTQQEWNLLNLWLLYRRKVEALKSEIYEMNYGKGAKKK